MTEGAQFEPLKRAKSAVHLSQHRAQAARVRRRKSNRGDRRLSFPNELSGFTLFGLAIAQVEKYSAEAFAMLGAAAE